MDYHYAPQQVKDEGALALLGEIRDLIKKLTEQNEKILEKCSKDSNALNG